MNLIGSIGDRLSCVDLSHDERHDVSTTLPGQNHYLSGLNKSIIVETGDRRNEAMSSSLAAGKMSTAAWTTGNIKESEMTAAMSEVPRQLEYRQ